MKNLFTALLLTAYFAITAHASDDNPWVFEASTEQGFFVLSLQPKDDEPVIGDYHDWVIEVTDENGKGVENAAFKFGGGMAAHGHGLPSQPTVTKHLGGGKYLIEGMLFNMAGDWSLIVSVGINSFVDNARFDMTLGF